MYNIPVLYKNNTHQKVYTEQSKYKTFNFKVGLNSKILFVETIFKSSFLGPKRLLISNSLKSLNYLCYANIMLQVTVTACWVHGLASSECGMCVAKTAVLCCTSRKDLTTNLYAGGWPPNVKVCWWIKMCSGS